MASGSENNISLVILGCGKLGTALLLGLLSQTKTEQEAPGHRRVGSDLIKIESINCIVRSSKSQSRIQDAIRHHHDKCTETPTVATSNVSDGETTHSIAKADLVILGCKPTALVTMIDDSRLVSAISQSSKKKLLVSLVGGTTIGQVATALSGIDTIRCSIFRAILSIAAEIGFSMTILSGPVDTKIPENDQLCENQKLVASVFGRVGPTTWLPERQLHRASALAASSLALYSKIILAAAEGVMTRDEDNVDDEPIESETAISIAARAAYGAAGLIMNGEHPNNIVEKVATKGGSTRAGLDVMTSDQVESKISGAIKRIAEATATLSKRTSNSHTR